MTHEPTIPPLQPEPAPPATNLTPPGLEDDLDFSDVQLGDRQENAIQGIVCEGGCE